MPDALRPYCDLSYVEANRALMARKMAVLHEIGLQTARVAEFGDLASAENYIERHPARYVLKFNGDGFGAADTYVGRLADGRDVAAMIAAKFRQMNRERIGFVLVVK